MSDHQDNTTPAPIYQIRIEGHLGEHWAEVFGGMSFTLTDDGDTLLYGPVADQAALHGLLRRIRDSGMSLVSVIRLSDHQ